MTDRPASEIHAELTTRLIETRAIDETTSELMADLYAAIRELERKMQRSERAVYYHESVADRVGHGRQ